MWTAKNTLQMFRLQVIDLLAFFYCFFNPVIQYSHAKMKKTKIFYALYSQVKKTTICERLWAAGFALLGYIEHET
jgi:hypothetical protein